MNNKKDEPSWCKMYRKEVLKPKQQQRYTEQKGRTEASRKGFYTSPEWIVIRNKRRQENPLCQRCESLGYVTPMKMVDHIQPIEERPDLALSYENTQSLCDRCHSIKTNEDKKAKKMREKKERGKALMKSLEYRGDSSNI